MGNRLPTLVRVSQTRYWDEETGSRVDSNVSTCKVPELTTGISPGLVARGGTYTATVQACLSNGTKFKQMDVALKIQTIIQEPTLPVEIAVVTNPINTPNGLAALTKQDIIDTLTVMVDQYMFELQNPAEVCF